MKSVEAIKILHGCDLEGRILFRSRELGGLSVSPAIRSARPSRGSPRTASSSASPMTRTSTCFSTPTAATCSAISRRFFLRPGEVTYESLESAASQWGFISQIPLGRISCVTTGAEGLVDTRFGAIEFVHTNDGLNDVKRGILDRMPRNRLPIATEERCLHDLVSRKRSLELIDWDEVDAD